MNLIPQFKIRIVYKSGYKHDFWTWSFVRTETTMTWDSVDNTNKPLVIGIDDIASIWQVGTRWRLRWSK